MYNFRVAKTLGTVCDVIYSFVCREPMFITESTVTVFGRTQLYNHSYTIWNISWSKRSCKHFNSEFLCGWPAVCTFLWCFYFPISKLKGLLKAGESRHPTISQRFGFTWENMFLIPGREFSPVYSKDVAWHLVWKYPHVPKTHHDTLDLSQKIWKMCKGVRKILH